MTSHTEWTGWCETCYDRTLHWTIYARNITEVCRRCGHGTTIRRFHGWE